MVAVLMVLMSALGANGMNESMCQEVRVELELAVKEGIISEEVMEMVAGRCFDGIDPVEEPTK
tara:strand:+ start:491 stop:679 length:189 start_codon:yes stop_codon:yes gene_type:complete